MVCTGLVLQDRYTSIFRLAFLSSLKIQGEWAVLPCFLYDVQAYPGKGFLCFVLSIPDSSGVDRENAEIAQRYKALAFLVSQLDTIAVFVDSFWFFPILLRLKGSNVLKDK